MSDQQSTLFTAEQVAAATTALRMALGLPPQHVTIERFVAAISDEIERLREAAWEDQAIADLVHEATGEPVSAAEIALFYSAPKRRTL